MLTTWTVDSLDDLIANDGKTTLREAVAAARTNQQSGDAIAGSDNDVIRFSESLFTDGPQVLPLTTNQPLNVDNQVSSDDGLVTIVGPGSTGTGQNREWLLTIDGLNSTGVFTIGDTVTLAGIAIANSSTTAVSITNRADLTLDDVHIAGSGGAAIHIPGGSLLVSNSVLTDNTNTGRGGAISVDGVNAEAIVRDTVITQNQADEGGGISNRAGRVVVLRSTISDNIATGGTNVGNGGAIVAFAGAKTSVHESTITGNTSAASGGAFRNRESELVISDAVLSDNRAAGDGGGISFVQDETAKLAIRNTTIANNSAVNGAGIDNQGGLLDIHGTAIYGNVARGGGGGIASRQGLASGNPLEPDTLVVNSTVSGNRAFESGGGIWQEAGTMLLTNLTVTMNRSDADGNGSGTGGGLMLNNELDNNGVQPFEMLNTIVAGNASGQSAPVTIDNSQSGFQIDSGTWGTSTGTGFAGGYRTNTRSDGSALVSWTFHGLDTGRYRVLATWVPSASNATDAPYTINDGRRVRRVVDRNQQVEPRPDAIENGTHFHELATVTVGTGELVVQLSNAANGRVVADAIRIERVDDGSPHSDIEVLNDRSLQGVALWNLIGDPDSAGKLVNDPSGQSNEPNIVGRENENSQLVPWDIDRILFTELADNLGGPTAVHALKVDSPAIDAGSFFRPGGSRMPFSDAFGDPPKPLTSDQRGLPYLRADARPLSIDPPDTVDHPDEERYFRVDIGAFELQSRPLYAKPELVVSTLEDESDGDFSRGDLSLREAVEIANLSSDHNAIRFATSLISDDGTAGTITLTSALQVDWDLTLTGPGKDLLNLSGGDSSRILEIGPLASVEISGLTFQHGRGAAERGRQFNVFTVDVAGGALFNAGSTTLNDVTFENNVDETASDFFNVAGGGAISNIGALKIRDGLFESNRAMEEGGAIRNRGGKLHIGPDVLIWRNSAKQGGGIDTSGDLLLVDSRVESNSAEEGGGISVTAGNATAEIRRSVIEANRVDIKDIDGTGVGGGVASYGSLLIYDTTIADNDIGTIDIPGDSTAQGGGIFVSGTFSRNSVVVIERSTLWSNEIHGGLSSQGGGLYAAAGAGNAGFRVVNSTISGNAAGSRKQGLGGGVFVTGSANDAPRISDTTIAFNEATKTNLPGHKSDGAGVFTDSLIHLSNVIVSNNEVKSSGATVPGGEVFIHADGSYPTLSNRGQVRVHSPVLVLGGAVSGGSLRNATNTSNVFPFTGDPQLGPLDINNGGFTATHKLNGVFNDAVDQGERVGLVDQRGYPVTDIVEVRPGGPISDIGAYESNEQVRIESFVADIRGASQFGTGDAFIVGVGIDDGRDNSLIPKEPAFLGLEFDPDPFTIGPGIGEGTGLGDYWGAEVTADIDGRIGIEYGYYVNAGSVDTFYNGLFAYSIDDSEAENKTFTINTGATFTDGQFFTTSPRVSAYADLVFELHTSLSGEACVGLCAGFDFPLNIDAKTQLFSLNRQLKRTVNGVERALFHERDASGNLKYDDEGKRVLTTFSNDGLNPPAFDGDIQFGTAPIQAVAQKAGDKAVAFVVDEASQARKNRRTAEIELKSGKKKDGTSLSSSDRTARRETVSNSLKREKELVEKGKQFIRGCAGEIIVACVNEAEGDLLGTEVALEVGASAGGFDGTVQLGKVAVTLPDIQLADSSFDNNHGKLSATTDDFAFGSEQDHNRRVARVQVDAAALLGLRFGFPLGTYNVSAGPVSLEGTTVSYNVGPQFSITQDVEVEPFFDQNHPASFRFTGFSGTIDVTVGGIRRQVSSNETVDFIPGESVKVEWTGNKNVDIVPSLTVGNRFSNDIGMDFDVVGTLEILKLALNAFGEKIFDVGPLYEHEHSLLDALGIGAVDLGSIFDESFNLPATRTTLKDTKDRDGDGNTTEDLVIRLRAGVNDVPSDGRTPGSAIPLTSDVRFTFDPGQRPDENTTVYFSLPLINENGVVGRDISFSSGQLTSFVRPPYSGLTVEYKVLNNAGSQDTLTEFELDVSGTDIPRTVESWKLKGFENLLESRAIFGLRFRSGGPASVLATLEIPESLPQVSLVYDEASETGIFLGNDPDRRHTAESLRELEQATNSFVYDNDLAFDIDNNGVISVTTDGVLVARYMDGRTGSALIDGAVASDSVRRNESVSHADEILAHLHSLKALGRLDVDDSSNNGDFDPEVDGTLILRHLAGIGLSTTSGPALTDGLVDKFPASAKRRHPQDIAEFIDGRRGPRVNRDFADETHHRSTRGISGAAAALDVAPNAVPGSSPWHPLSLPLIDGDGNGLGDFGNTIALTTYGHSVGYEDLFLNRVNDPTQRDLLRTNSVGTPARIVDIPAGISSFALDPTSPEITSLASRMVLETRQQNLGTEEPIFVKLPYHRNAVGGYTLMLPAGASVQQIVFDAAVGGNAFLDHQPIQNGSDVDFDIFLPGTNETFELSMHTGLQFRDGNGNFRTDVREIRLQPRGIANTQAFGEANLAEPDLDITVGLILTTATNGPPDLSVEILDESLASTTIARAVPLDEPETQIVMVLTDETVSTNQIFPVHVEYHATDTTAGIPPALLVEVHYDSDRVRFDGIDNLLATGLVNSFTANSPEDVELVSDGDIRTDSVIVLSWADFFGAWPAGATTGTRLATINFQAQAVTGTTDLRLTGSSSADYRFSGDLSKTINIARPDAENLTVDIAAQSISEGDGAAATTATVTRTGPTNSNLTVLLSSSDGSEAAVPRAITIVAGQSTSAPFNISAVDDNVNDGTQNVIISASADGMIGGSRTLAVTDNETNQTQPYVVTTLVDELDPASTDVSLREAILAANSDAGHQQITFADGLSGTLTLTRGELAVTDSVEISGPGARAITVDANGQSRVFNVDNSASSLLDVTISGLTITGGTSAEAGGAIYSSENLTLAEVTVSDSTSSSGDFLGGGGLFGRDGTVVLTGSTFSGNSVTSSRGEGAAVRARFGTTLIVNNSTFSGNTSSTVGGAIAASDIRRAEINNTTIANNTGQRGALFLWNLSEDGLVRNSILADNISTLNIDPDYDFGSAGTRTFHNSLIEDGDTVTGSNNIIGLDPMLSPLQDNGGPTQTHVLLPGSPAIDAGDGAFAVDAAASPLTSDQRGAGFSRVLDGDNDGTARVDMGALEAAGALTVTAPSGASDNRRPTITWSAVTGAASYDVFLELIQTGANTALLSTSTSGTSMPLPQTIDDLGIGRYRAWVRATLPSGKTPWVTSDFQINIETTVTELPFYGSNPRPTISWTAVPGAVGYRVYVGNVTARMTPFDVSSADTSFTPDSDLQFGRHRIWVRAIGPQNYPAAWSAVEEYYLGPSLLAISPDQLTASQLDAELKLQLPATNFDNWGGLNERWVIDQAKVFYYILPDGRFYRWTVGTGRENGPLSGTQLAQLTPAHHANIRLLTEPTVNESTFDLRPQFRWTAVPGVGSYRLLVRRGSTTVIDEPTLTGTTFTPPADLAFGDHRWWVLPSHANGRSGVWSETGSFFAGGRPTVTLPADIDTSGLPTIHWNPVHGTGSYEIYLFNDDGRGLVQRVAGVTDASFETVPLPDGNYRVWVRSYAANGNPGFWSRAHSFVVDAAVSGLETVLGAPILPTFDTTPTFFWSESPGASSYDIHLTDGTTRISQNVTAATWTPATPLNAGQWQWWARARNATDAAGLWSDPASFDTSGRPVLTGPIGTTSDRTPTITWTLVEGASRYAFQLDNLTTGQNSLLRDDNVTSNRFTPSGSLSPGDYRAWVRAINGNTGRPGPWSVKLEFSIADAVSENPEEFALPADLLTQTRKRLLTRHVSDAKNVTQTAPAESICEEAPIPVDKTQDLDRLMQDPALLHDLLTAHEPATHRTSKLDPGRVNGTRLRRRHVDTADQGTPSTIPISDECR